jgi:hypothetical protein
MTYESSVSLSKYKVGGTFRMLEIEKLEFARTLKRAFQIPHVVVYLQSCISIRRPLDVVMLTFAMTIRSDRLLDTSLATSIGLVSQLFPLRSDPSGIVMTISSRG